MFSLQLPNPMRASLHVLLGYLQDQRPASRLIRKTAREHWKLLGFNLSTNLGMALTEGITLGLIYVAIEVINGGFQVAHRLPHAWADFLDQFPASTLFIILMVLALLMQVSQSIIFYLNRVSIGFFAARCQVRIFALIHRRILAFSYPCASHYRVGDLTTHLSSGPAAVSNQINIANDMISSSLMLVVYLLVLLRLSPWLMLAAFGLGALMASIQRSLLPRIRSAASSVSSNSIDVTNRSIEDIQGLRLLHSTGQLNHASEHLSVPLRNLERSLRRRSKISQVIEPFSRILPILAFVPITIMSVAVFKERSAGVLPNLLTFMLALQRLNTRMAALAQSSNLLADNSKNFERLNDILDSRDKQLRRQGGIPFHRLTGSIRFDQVCLTYADDLPRALDNITFTLPKGRTVALVGSSGAGKSSIADLLVGLYNPTSGRILIDGLDLARLDLASWQQKLGVVSQDTFLFNRSLAENISFGCPWATDHDVAIAAERAQAASFISSLPDGFNTLVGERGYRLSGGQRQRISLARALLRNPELLILDEATSALDTESERLVQQAIEAFNGQQTVLVIAHRLSTIMNADEILVLDNGRIVERGSHPSLLRASGRYSQLWIQQSQLSSDALCSVPQG